MLASVIIPTHNRVSKTERAIKHILKQANSEMVQIVIVDDCSEPPFKSSILRSIDKVIRMKSNQGAAVCRNKGITESNGKLIYLLDSDDYFVERDFISDFNMANKCKAIFYCDHLVGKRRKNYPRELNKSTFFEQIFYKNEGIGQTSSLFFAKELDVKFDEVLPKHQDWDLLYGSLMKKNLKILKSDGLVCLDKGDQNSISRKLTPKNSYLWLRKLEQDLPIAEYDWVRFNILAKFSSEYRWKSFLLTGIKYVLQSKYTFKLLIKRFIQRILLRS
jgi:glycosyltransferase involved in cell wall biosynthesis